MIIGIPVYQDVDLLDVIGPKEIFSWIPEKFGVTVELIADKANKQSITSRDGLTFTVEKTFEDVLQGSTCSGCRAATLAH